MPTKRPSSASSALSPTIFIIFGVTGDLAGTKLLPALLSLYVKKSLPERFAIVGVSRRHFSREELRDYLRGRMNIKPGQFYEEDVKHFLDHVSYVEGQFDASALYDSLKAHLTGIDDRWGQCSNKLFHLSVPPALYGGILRRLSESDLTEPCADKTGWTRILVEKPFGEDTATARALDKLLGSLFKEPQIFRIDHYLAKEALQNVIAFRFGNSMFEPLWSRQFVEKVHIKLLERDALGSRGSFYDQTGALKDVGQNHLLAMLALVAMERPESLDAAGIRRERARVLSRLAKLSSREVAESVRGRYEGYLREPGVKADSATETYFRLEARVSNRRWKGVPFHLESGKGLFEDRVEIDLYFKDAAGEESGNILTFRIQPDEGIKVRFFVKKPGQGFETEPRVLKFRYNDSPSLSALPDAYERLIHDAIVGDQTLFASTDEILASWRFITPILEQWKAVPLVEYQKGAKEV